MPRASPTGTPASTTRCRRTMSISTSPMGWPITRPPATGTPGPFCSMSTTSWPRVSTMSSSATTATTSSPARVAAMSSSARAARTTPPCSKAWHRTTRSPGSTTSTSTAATCCSRPCCLRITCRPTCSMRICRSSRCAMSAATRRSPGPASCRPSICGSPVVAMSPIRSCSTVRTTS